MFILRHKILLTIIRNSFTNQTIYLLIHNFQIETCIIAIFTRKSLRSYPLKERPNRWTIMW